MSQETHSDSDKIECPVCGESIDGLDEYGRGRDGSFKIECSTCDVTLVLSRQTTVDYSVKADA